MSRSAAPSWPRSPPRSGCPASPLGAHTRHRVPAPRWRRRLRRGTALVEAVLGDTAACARRNTAVAPRPTRSYNASIPAAGSVR
eukprot:scaffold831_cov336-Prasinococcus_capsulatus_cf.AAC.2